MRLDWLWFLGLDLDNDVPHHSVLSKARNRFDVGGIMSVVTGGGGVYRFEKPVPNSEIRDSSTYGVLKLTLGLGSYQWVFAPPLLGRSLIRAAQPAARHRKRGSGNQGPRSPGAFQRFVRPSRVLLLQPPKLRSTG